MAKSDFPAPKPGERSGCFGTIVAGLMILAATIAAVFIAG